MNAVTDEMVEAAAEIVWNDLFGARGGAWDNPPPDSISGIQTRATARAALTAALSIRHGGVKALGAWRRGYCDDRVTIEQASTGFGSIYQVRVFDGIVWLDLPDQRKEEFPTALDAKAAAQADFNTRILSALEPIAPAPDACQCCGRPYESDLLVDDATWERIQPDNGEPGAGLLCPDCILTRTGWACGIAVDGHGDRHSSEVTICGKVHRLDGGSSPAQEIADKPSAVSVGDDWVRDTAMNVMMATEVEEAILILRLALKAAQEGK